MTFTNFQRPLGSPFTFVAAENAVSAPDSYRIEAAYRESAFTKELNYRFDPVAGGAETAYAVVAGIPVARATSTAAVMWS